MPCGVRAGLAALAFLAVAAAPASGQVGVPDPVQQSQAIDRQLSQYRQQYAEVSADEVDLLAHVDVARQAKDAADLELARLDSSLHEALTALTAAQQARDAAAAASAAAAAELTGARAKVAAAEDLLRRQALDAYVDQGRFGVLTAVFAPASDEDALTAPYYARLAGGIEADRVTGARDAARGGGGSGERRRPRRPPRRHRPKPTSNARRSRRSRRATRRRRHSSRRPTS